MYLNEASRSVKKLYRENENRQLTLIMSKQLNKSYENIFNYALIITEIILAGFNYITMNFQCTSATRVSGTIAEIVICFLEH